MTNRRVRIVKQRYVRGEIDEAELDSQLESALTDDLDVDPLSLPVYEGAVVYL